MGLASISDVEKVLDTLKSQMDLDDYLDALEKLQNKLEKRLSQGYEDLASEASAADFDDQTDFELEVDDDIESLGIDPDD